VPKSVSFRPRVFDARLEPARLFGLPDFQPEYDQLDAIIDHELLSQRAKLQARCRKRKNQLSS
jgi:hypothetical protein